MFWKKATSDQAGERDFLESYKELQRVKREHEELENLIAWLNKLCSEQNMQMCGLRKIPSDSNLVPSHYIGFVLSSSVKDMSDGYYQFAILGFASPFPCFGNPDCFVQVSQGVRGVGSDFVNTLSLTEIRVQENIQQKGVGSAALSMIKELAKHLRCSEIHGKRKAIPDTPEERDKLTAFYHANGFSQEEGSNKIIYDMRHYKDEAKKKKDIHQNDPNQNDVET